MCGICGIYNIGSESMPQPTLEKEVRRMNERLVHRGPDAEGYYSDQGIALGHKRLSIIDLSTGSQPIYNEDRSCVIVYNGELYNYKPLRKDLIEKGHIFSTVSDTEVILHAYEEYGVECLSLFNGMFAFAIWDSKLERLFVARDRLGIKPLYFHWQREQQLFVFASEIKSLLAMKDVKSRLNTTSLADYLVFQNILDEKTFFETINILQPGHFAILTAGRFVLEKFWQPNFKKTHLSDISEYLHRFEELLEASVSRQLMSDVPLGSYLSGGFDSSSIATVASELLDDQVATFTGFFKEGGVYDERREAALVATRIGSTNHQVEIRQEDFISNIYDIIYHLDEPKVGSGVFPQYQVSKLVSQYVKVVLTGHGGDELFCGYPLYKMHYFRDLIRKNPLRCISLFQQIHSGEYKAAIVNILFPIFRKEMGLGINLSWDSGKWRSLLHPALKAELVDYNPLESLYRIIEQGPEDRMDRVQNLYLKTYLPSLFIVEDKVGMAHSIEARLPLCDNEMVDYALSVPIEDKLYDNQLKYIIKKSMQKKLPEELYLQPKKGFPTPMAKWFREGLKGFVEDVLLSDRCLDRGVFDPDILQKTVKKHMSGKQNNQHALWRYLCVEIWHQVFLDGRHKYLSE